MRRFAARLSTDRVIVAASLVLIAALAWRYTVHQASFMADMSSMGMTPHALAAATPSVRPWLPGDVLLTFVMWAVMMVAMMTPVAAPVLLTFAGLTRSRAAPGAFAATAAFLVGYMLVWIGFSAGSTLLQWTLHSAGLLSPTALRATPAVSGGLLVLAGLYQLTPWKHACLSRCRSPLDFLMTTWRDGIRGALEMGARHGLHCVGCCWSLMLLLFAVGIMNLVWVAAIAGYALAEKLFHPPAWSTRAVGVLLIAWGVWVAAAA